MTPDEEVVQQADLALIDATMAFQAASAMDRLQLAGPLQKARESWGTARFRLLLPDAVASQADVEEARAIRATIDRDVDTQANVQALLQLGMLLAKFVH
jgi:hypothetical protein